MAIKKSELYSSLWKSCDELRGGMDASQYKDYVLVLLFVKYVSDKYAGQKDALLDAPAGGGFADMIALKGDVEIGDKMNKIIARLAEANDLKGVIDVADFNDADKLGGGKEMVDRLSNLVSIFDNPGLDFRGNRAEGDDILGDAYEYLMRNCRMISRTAHMDLQKRHADLLNESASSSTNWPSGGRHHSGDPGVTLAIAPGMTLAITAPRRTLTLAIHRRRQPAHTTYS